MRIRRLSMFCVILMAVVLLISSCFNDPVHDDLVNYINKEIAEIAELESKVAEDWESVSSENYKGSEIMYNALVNGIIDNSEKLVKEAGSITPKTDKLKEVHEMYIAAVNEQHNAFIIVKAALEEGEDSEKISDANKKLKNARKLMLEFMDQIDKLAEKHDLKISIYFYLNKFCFMIEL